MKKILLLPLMAVAGLVSQAWAVNCLYGSGDCWPDDGKSCEGGWQYEGGTTGEGTLCSGGDYIGPGPKTTGDPPTSLKPSLGCCKWDTQTQCWDVFTQSEVSDCGTGANQFWNTACPDKQGGCPGAAPSSSSAVTTPSSSSGGGNSPILLGASTSASLMVLVQSSDLYISSVKAARLSLFDMSGKEVLNQSVQAGYSKLSLDGQKQGVYFAVVSSGSSKQTVRVVLK